MPRQGKYLRGKSIVGEDQISCFRKCPWEYPALATGCHLIMRKQRGPSAVDEEAGGLPPGLEFRNASGGMVSDGRRCGSRD